MKRYYVAVFCIATAFSLYCGGIPPTYYYRIDYDFSALDTNASTVPVTLGIATFDADVLYEGDRIVYRHSPYEVQYYHYRRWIAPPKKIVKEKVLKQFQASGLFNKVVELPSPLKVDYILKGKIVAFEEWDEADSWFGLVSIRFQLVDARTEEVAWENEFSAKTRALKRQPVEVVKAISESLKKVVQEAIKNAAATLKAATVG